jgi:hypothetical protein
MPLPNVDRDNDIEMRDDFAPNDPSWPLDEDVQMGELEPVHLNEAAGGLVSLFGMTTSKIENEPLTRYS